MPSKRKRNISPDLSAIHKKLKRLEEKLLAKQSASRKRPRRRIIESSSSSSGSSRESSPTPCIANEQGDRLTPVESILEDILGAESVYAAPPVRPQQPQPEAAAAGQTPAAPADAGDASPLTSPLNTIEPIDASDLIDTLDQEILNILGDDPSTKVEYGGLVHKEIASRFEHFAVTGIDKELRKELTDKYLVPENCSLTCAPILNDEIRAALPEPLLKRDKLLQARQKQIATIISCVATAFTEQIKQNDKNHDLLKRLMDMGRLLCDLQHMESVTRRNFCMYSVKKEMKDHLTNTKISAHLFGDNLSETLKSAKAVQKSGSELQVPSKNITKYRPQTVKAQQPKNRKQPAPVRRPQGAAHGRDHPQRRAPPPASRRSSPPPRPVRRR